jgi:hypothetical protein
MTFYVSAAGLSVLVFETRLRFSLRRFPTFMPLAFCEAC